MRSLRIEIVTPVLPSLAIISCPVENTSGVRGCSAKVNCTGLHGSGTQKRDLADEKRTHGLLKEDGVASCVKGF